MFPTSLLAEENVCDRIITGGGYQEYLDDLPSYDFNSAFHIVVGDDGSCTYGWDWWETNRALEDVMQDSFNDCEEGRKKKNIDGECRPYDINRKIVWGKPELYEELVAASSPELENSKCHGFFLENFNDYKSTNNKYFYTVESEGRCEYGMGKDADSAFNECEKFRQENNIGGKCEPFAVEDQIVWGKPELYAELTGSKFKPSEEIQKSMDEGDYDSVDVGMWQLDGIINSTDPSTLQKVIYIGKEKRNFIEARTDREDKSRLFEFKATPYVYDAYYENGKIFEILIYFENEKNKSKGKDGSLAEKYAFMIGQMPNVLLQRLDAAHIYADVLGISNASAKERIINIHPEGEGGYVFVTAIEELFIHELVHASLDKPIHGVYQAMNKKRHKNSTIKSKKLNWGDWRQAVKKDKKKYITKYAKTSIHEDLAESFTAWLALRYKDDRISDIQKVVIEKKIPNRIKYFDEQEFDMYPLVLSD